MSRGLQGLCALAVLGLAAATSHAADYFPPSEPRGGWRRLVAPNTIATVTQKQRIRDTVGVDWDKLETAWNVSSRYGGSFLVIRNGWIVGEWGATTTATHIASCTKTLTGLAMQRIFGMSAAGTLPVSIGPDDLAYLYLPESWGNRPARQTITLRHILTMSSGLEPDDHPPSPDRDTTAYQRKILDPPVRTVPGAEWSYASLPVDALSFLTEEVTGLRLGAFFNGNIGRPIGVTTLKWGALGRHSYASAYASITARDLARIGYLMLNRGTWKGRSIIRAARIDEMTRPDPMLAGAVYGPQIQFPTDPKSHLRYGHLVWVYKDEGRFPGERWLRDAYYMAGARTKFMIVVPRLELIVVRIQNTPEAWSDELFTATLEKTVQSVISTT